MRFYQRGLSLLEMMVALAILGISLAALYQAMGGATRSVKVSEDYLYAITLAESLVAEYQLVPSAGLDISEQHETFHYRVTAEPLPTEQETRPLLMALRVSVEIVGSGERSVVLDSIVAGIENQ